MKKLNRVLSCIISVIMIVTALPVGVFADDANSNSSVTVYLTVSDDGYFAYGNDEDMTMLARVPITVDYFPLSEYGLEDYDRCEADTFENGGKYVNDTVVEKPTLLHLFIKAAEKYYLGGEKLVEGTDAMTVDGDATSMFFKKYWGHDYNQTYLVDHGYVLMNSTTSASADYILLEDGMEIDLCMFTKSNFFYKGDYAYFGQSEYNVSVGDEVSFDTYKSFVNWWAGPAPESPEALKGLYTTVSDENWFEQADLSEQAADDGKFTYTFDQPGKYYVTAIDYNAGDPDSALIAPAVAVVNVTEKEPKLIDGSIGYQKDMTNDDIRFVAQVSIADIQNADSGAFGFAVDDDEIYSQAIKNVYKSIYAGGKKLYAEEGKYFIVTPRFSGIDSGTQADVKLSLQGFDAELSRSIVIE